MSVTHLATLPQIIEVKRPEVTSEADWNRGCLSWHSSVLDRHEPLSRLRSPERGRQRRRDGERAVLRHGARHALRVDAARQREALRDVPGEWDDGRSCSDSLSDDCESNFNYLLINFQFIDFSTLTICTNYLRSLRHHAVIC